MSSRRKVKGYKPSTVQQNRAGETDINKMLAQATRMDAPLPVGSLPPMWGDFSAADFQQAQDMVVSVKAKFGGLKASTRALFQNSPLVMMQFLQNPDNHAEARRLGLMAPLPPETVREPSLAEQVAEGVKTALRADPESHPRKGGA